MYFFQFIGNRHMKGYVQNKKKWALPVKKSKVLILLKKGNYFPSYNNNNNNNNSEVLSYRQSNYVI